LIAAQLTELMMQNANQIGEFHPCSTKLRTLYANDNKFSSANLSGCFPEGRSATIRLQNNALTSINLANDTGIYSLNLENNSLNQTAVDDVLQVLNSYGRSHGILNLASNAAPSAAGIANACDLLNRSWTVTITQPTDMIILNEATNHIGLTNVSENTENTGVSPVSGSNFSNFSNNISGTINSGYILASIAIVALGAAGILRYLGFI
jgi:hypothetical protein